MRILLVVVIMLCFEGLHGQNETNFLDRRVSLDLTRATLKQVLKKIERQANVKFVYSRDHVDMTGFITIQVDDKPLAEVFETLLTPRKIKCIFEEDEYIILAPRKAHETVLGEHQSVTQKDTLKQEQSFPPFRITGRISSDSGVPLPGVSVLIKGTSKGVSSDVEGKFSIEVNKKDKLVFSYIGYRTAEVEIDSATKIDVTLKETTTSLDEVMVIAYSTSKQRTSTGSVGAITSKDIQNQPVSNPLQAMQGRIAGVYINQSNGLPGGAISVQIRGRNSIRNDGNEPFYLIDGVPYTSTSMSSTYVGSPYIDGINPLNSINPEVIQSITVLKDADATAIYGSRGANGVVLITTKKGNPGKPKIDLNVYSGIGQVTGHMDMLNTKEYIEMRKEAFKNDLALPTVYNAYDLLKWDTTRFTDWQKVLIGGAASVTNAQASISGGNHYTQFYCNGGLYNETTTFPGNFGYQKGSALLNINQKSANEKFNALLSIAYTSERNRLMQQDPTGQAFRLAPNAPAVYDSSGKLNWENSTWKNPFALMEGRYKSNSDNLILNANIGYSILPGLSVKANAGVTRMMLKEISTNPTTMANPALGVALNSAIYADSYVKTYIIEPQIEYEKNIKKNKLRIMLGSTYQQNLAGSQSLFGSGYISDALLENIQASTDVQILQVNNTQYRYGGIFGRVSYTLNEKYLINLTGRRDGSSRFGPDKQFANFGAIGAAWIFSNETILKNSPLSFGKIRSSLGTTGNDQIGDYQYYETYELNSPYEGGAGLVPNRFVNPDYSWETNQKFEAAVELGFNNDKILFTANYYRNLSGNQLVGMPLPSFTGQNSVQANLPAKVQNSGWEFEVHLLNTNGTKVTWSSAINLTIPKNKLLEYPNIAGSPYADRYAVGKPLSIQKKLHATGVDPQTGIYVFEDVNLNGISTEYPDDLLAIKSVGQQFFGGIQNTFTWKSLKLDLFIQFVKQTGFSYQFNNSTPPGFQATNQSAWVMDRWQKPGDASGIQRFTQEYGSDPFNAYFASFLNSDNVICDASFIRIKNLSLSYKLPEYNNFRIYFSAQNIFTISRYLGVDPETQSSLALPSLKVITAGIQLIL